MKLVLGKKCYFLLFSMDIGCFCQRIKDKEMILGTNLLASRETVNFVSWLEDTQCSMRWSRGQQLRDDWTWFQGDLVRV